MQIKVGDYEITSDKYNIIISEVITPKRKKSEEGGQPYTLVRGYFHSLKEAFLSLLGMKLKDSEATTLKELAESLESAEKEILSAVKAQTPDE